MGVTSTCCHAEFPYGATDRETRLARGTDEAREMIPEKHSVGATHVERFQEMTALEKHESRTTGYTTVMMLIFLMFRDLV